ncbi:MAG: hypothetical protein O3A95_06440 [Planctomycetota bacterium]|nr:hypothetical protein [Planctomycetota bacterium]MDA1113920.1 hypothetical protein [Planctomycetota bacterium]
MMRLLKAPTTALLLWLCASCSSSVLTDYPEDAYRGIDAFEYGEFDLAAQEFSALSGTLGSNDFLAHAEAGMAYHVGGNLEASTREWLAALEVVDGFKDRPTISGRSLSEGALSMLVNDKTMPYDGEGFEVVLLHSFLAWDFLRQGNLDGAMVEVKRGYEFERFERERYESTTGMNRFGRFIAALAQDVDGQYNDARIDLELLAEQIPNHPVVVYSQERIKRLQSSERQAELSFSEIVVVFENGRMPEKIAEEISYGTKRSFGRISVPRFSHVPQRARTLQVEVANSAVGATVSLENVMQVGRNNLNDRIAWVTTKALLRSAAKTIVVDHVAEEVEEEHGQWAGIFVGLAGSLLNTYSESADLRSWLTLPNDIQVLRARIEPGEHRILVHTSANNPPLDLGIYSFEAGSPVMISVRAIDNKLYASPRAHSDSLP